MRNTTKRINDNESKRAAMMQYNYIQNQNINKTEAAVTNHRCLASLIPEADTRNIPERDT